MRLAGRVRHTPIWPADPGGAPLWFKHEYLQLTGTFKARGAFNRILAAQADGRLDPAVGIVVASGGNAGLANAYAARAVGIPATVFVPERAPRVKVERLRAYGARVVAIGSEYAEAAQAAFDFAGESGAVLNHAYDQLEIVAGAGTLGLEIAADLAGQVDTVIVAVGGGGLLAGVAAALEGQARVIAVEPMQAPTLHAALAAGGPTEVAVGGMAPAQQRRLFTEVLRTSRDGGVVAYRSVAADSLGARRVGNLAWAVATRTGVASLLVEDEEIVRARQHLWDEYRIVVEHGAATAFAAVLCGAYRPTEGERVVVVLCGANTDPADLSGPIGSR